MAYRFSFSLLPVFKNLLILYTFRDVAQPGSALRSGRRGRWFESSHPDWQALLITGLFFNMRHYVYMLQSLKDGRYYIGETRDVEARLKFHNSGQQRSTKNRIPFRIVLVEEYLNREEALKREKQIKSWKGGEAFKIY